MLGTKTINTPHGPFTVTTEEYNEIVKVVTGDSLEKAARWWALKYHTAYDKAFTFITKFKAEITGEKVQVVNSVTKEFLFTMNNGVQMSATIALQITGQFARMYKLLTGKEVFFRQGSGVDDGFTVSLDPDNDLSSIHVSFQRQTSQSQTYIMTFLGLDKLFHQYPELVGCVRSVMLQENMVPRGRVDQSQKGTT